MKIDGRVSLIPMPSGVEWVNEHDVRFWIDRDGVPNGWLVTVEERFVTDLTSRPTIMAMLLDKWGKHGPAALAHDWLYWWQPCTRAEADEAMRTIMLACGVPGWKVRLIMAALRVGGWKAWRDNRRRREAGEDAFFRGDLDRLNYLAVKGD